MAYYSSNENVLRRWASLSDRPMPDDFRDFSDRYLTESMLIRQRDPQLVSILEGTADGNLKADVVSGKFDIVAPTEEQQAEAARQAEAQRLFDSNPFASNNLTDQMKLRQLAPEAAAQLQDAAAKHQQPEMTEMRLKQMEVEQQKARQHSMLKGMSMAQGEENMRLRRQQLLKQHRGDVRSNRVRK